MREGPCSTDGDPTHTYIPPAPHLGAVHHTVSTELDPGTGGVACIRAARDRRKNLLCRLRDAVLHAEGPIAEWHGDQPRRWGSSWIVPLPREPFHTGSCVGMGEGSERERCEGRAGPEAGDRNRGSTDAGGYEARKLNIDTLADFSKSADELTRQSCDCRIPWVSGPLEYEVG